MKIIIVNLISFPFLISPSTTFFLAYFMQRRRKGCICIFLLILYRDLCMYQEPINQTNNVPLALHDWRIIYYLPLSTSPPHFQFPIPILRLQISFTMP